MFLKEIENICKFGDLFQSINLRNSTNPEKDKSEKNHTLDHHFQTPDNQIQSVQRK